MGANVTRWARTTIAGAVAVLAVAGIALAVPATAAATVSGGCVLTATSTSGGTVDLTTAGTWHLKTSDRVSGSATAATPQTDVSISVSVPGFALPIAGGHADGVTSAQSAEYDVSTLALLGRVFLLSGSSTGPGGGCSGQVEIVIDDANPLLSALGAGSIAAVVLGLLGMAWAVRNPASPRRMILGLVFGAVVGAGGSMLLQQTSFLGGGKAEVFGRSAFVDAVAGPAQVSLDPAILAQTALLTLLVVVLLPFPSELFNRTLEANVDEIRAALRRLPLVGRLVRMAPPADTSQPVSTGPGHLMTVALFVLVSGLLYGLLDPSFGLDARSLVTYTGIVLALVGVTWAANLPHRAVHAAAGDRGRLEAVPGTLAVAAACVLVSRLVDFQPGYLYGLVLGYAFARRFDVPQEGRTHALSAGWMLGLSLVAWLTLGAIRGLGIEGSVPAAIAESVLAALVVAGIEGIVFGLVPLRFLPGEAIFRWQRWRWALLYAIGVFGFIAILLNPTSGFLTPAKQGSFLTAVSLLVGFGLVSVLFWGYFRFRPVRGGS